MKVKKKLNYATFCIVFLIGLIIGYSNNFAKTKKFYRTHAPIGIDLELQLTFIYLHTHNIITKGLISRI